MITFLKNYNFPYKTVILYISLAAFLFPLSINPYLPYPLLRDWGRMMFMFFTFISFSGFIYSIIGFYYHLIKGDELKLKIHLESLNAAFTISLVIFFVLAFIFLNFAPTLLNDIMEIFAIVLIVSYLLATQFIRDKYQ